jgi:hypothetical protein
MGTLFLLGFVLSGILSFTLFGASKGAIHESIAAILLLCSITCLIGFVICDRLDKIRKAIERADENNWKINHAVWRELREPGNKDPEPTGTAAEK